MSRILILAFLALFLSGCSDDDNNKVEGTGTIEIVASVLSSRMPGEISKIIKDEGMSVRKGDTLIIIDHKYYSIQLKAALANLKITEGALDLLRNGARKEDIELAETQLKQAELNLNSAETDYKRFKELIAANSVTQKQYEDAETRYKIAGEQTKAAQESLRKLKHFARTEEIKQAQGRYEQALANVELLEKQISDCYITAPFDGVIIKRFIQLGETVGINSSILKIADTGFAELTIYIPEEQLPKVKYGQKVTVAIDMNPDKKYEGTVSFISSEAEFTPKNIQTKDERTKLVFAVKIKLPNNHFELKSGLPADAVIEL
ncbi:MAG: HlyD family efflux transporter periplasmic adaptor subunit [Ignavibacteriaceae bacterium]|nr:HlyD family efflux transporter periplasmic adaptor subunit [Ignavibacteriaceae bacterium]